MKRIAIFASGSGTNAENIAKYFQKSDEIKVSLILTNKSDAYVIQRAEKLSIPVMIFSRKDFYDDSLVLGRLLEEEIDLVVLAGFLWLVPPDILRAYEGRIINIHPALLPKYGGKGMYGDRVHKAVKESGDKESGITIHYVNEIYDAGEIIFQEKCPVDPEDTPDDIAQKVHQLEYERYPKIIEKLLL
jgi:phosphoribosylglycinamide formyltransferase-1